jgi:hypothetical protein
MLPGANVRTDGARAQRSSGLKPVRFEGAGFFRQRLIYATLSGRDIKIENIRSAEVTVGLRGERVPRWPPPMPPLRASAADYEASFLRLLDKISNGCAIKINETGMAAGRRNSGLGWAQRMRAQARRCGTAPASCTAAAPSCTTARPRAPSRTLWRPW